MLVGAGELLAPDCFTHSVGRPSHQEKSSRKVKEVSRTAKERVPLQDLGRKLSDYELGKAQVEGHTKAADSSTEKQRYKQLRAMHSRK